MRLESRNASRRFVPENPRRLIRRRPTLGAARAEGVQFDALDREALDRVRNLNPKATNARRRSVDQGCALHRSHAVRVRCDARSGPESAPLRFTVASYRSRIRWTIALIVNSFCTRRFAASPY